MEKFNYPVIINYTTVGYLRRDEPDNIFVRLKKHLDKKGTHIPVITIVPEDLINISDPNLEKKYKRFVDLKVDRRFLFLDSSIWNYYLFIGEDFKNKFERVLNEIKKNYEKELYDIAAAKEYIELYYRIAENSYLRDIDAHASQVSPFVFHSERKMKELADKKLEKLQQKFEGYDGKIVWNILLIDDYSEKVLRGAKQKSKKDLIEDILKEDGLIKGSPKYDQSKFEIIFHTTPDKNVLEDVRKKIIDGQNKKDAKIVYDILFLDFLLGKKKGRSEREYGHEFFLKGYFEEIAKYRCPLNRFWVFPITVFTTALIDSILQNGIPRLSENWFIANGADPINTPELFRYNFYSLLEYQLNETVYTKEDIINFLEEHAIIDDKTEKKDDEIRLWAKQVFGSFIFKFGKRAILYSDGIRGSEFARTILKYIKHTKKDDFRFFNHIRQLLYLIAYGTGHHATQMWELLNFVEYEIFVSNKKEKSKELKETFRELIPKYITNLSKLNS